MNKKEKKEKIGFYKKNYKRLLILPFALFMISALMIINTIQKENSPIYRDVSLKGGLSVILEINTTLSPSQFEEQLDNYNSINSFSVSQLNNDGKDIGFIIDTDMDEDNLILILNEIFDDQIIQGENYNSNYISPTLSNSFFRQAIFFGLLPAFILMSLVVFLYFKEFVPSFAVVLSAIFDIIVTVGILDMFGFKISIAGIGAIIMLVGYSIDTDILLTNRLIKEPGSDYFEKSFFAFKTGTLMSLTTLMAGVVAVIISNSQVIVEICTILIVGLLVDFISTWIQNNGILLWWLEKE